MVRIILVRPGSTDFDEQGRIKGTLDIPLSPRGNDQIGCMADELAGQGIEVVYTSPCQAAEQTARVLSQALGVKSKRVERLRNLDHGLWQGKLIEEVKEKQRKVYRQWQDQPDTVCPPEGEMLSAARERVRQAIEKILKKHRQGVLAVVAPEPLASVVRCHLTQTRLGDLWQAETVCGGWEAIDVLPEQILTSSETIT